VNEYTTSRPGEVEAVCPTPAKQAAVAGDWKSSAAPAVVPTVTRLSCRAWTPAQVSLTGAFERSILSRTSSKPGWTPPASPCQCPTTMKYVVPAFRTADRVPWSK
jgi:hypothetical protein